MFRKRSFMRKVALSGHISAPSPWGQMRLKGLEANRRAAVNDNRTGDCTVVYVSESMPITEARAQFGSLVRRASHARERITITDHGQPAAVLINPQELADLEDALALAEYRNRQGAGSTVTVPHGEVRARLGIVPG